MALIHDFHFIRPLWLLALPLLWGFGIWLARRSNADGNWNRLIDAELLNDLLLDKPARSPSTPWPWLILAWTLATLAMAGPSWQQAPVTAYRGHDAWVFILDLSPSMTATDVAPNRYTRARFALEDLLGAAKDARVALIAFSDEPYIVTPLTEDVATVRSLLPPLAPDIMPTAGHNLAPALQQAADMLKQSGSKGGRVIVLADGFDYASTAFGEASKLQQQGISVNTVGIGNPNATSVGGLPASEPLQAAKLQQLAAQGGGSYVNLAQLPSLISTLQSQADRTGKAKAESNLNIVHWIDGGIWLLPLLLIVSALLSRRGWL